MKSDAEIAADVLASLAWDPRVDETEISVRSNNGVVALTGNVSTYARKFAAAQDARRVEGVKDIVNEINVKPEITRSDYDIADDVKAALTWDTRVDPKEVSVGVRGGVVTLSGKVDSFAEKRAAEEDTWWTPGVVDVDNDLSVANWQSRTDEELKNAVHNAFIRDVWVPTKDITIEVTGGVVRLKGEVGSFAEKTAAEDDAWWTPGAINVINDLEVRSPAEI